MFMQLLSKDALFDKTGCLDTITERQYLQDTTILEDSLSQKVA